MRDTCETCGAGFRIDQRCLPCREKQYAADLDAAVEAERQKWAGHYADLLISVSTANESENRAALLIEFLEQCHRDGLNCLTAANAIRARSVKR